VEIQFAKLALLAVPVTLREYLNWGNVRSRPKGKRIGGTLSGCLRFSLYIILLVLAFRKLFTTQISLGGWIGYFVLWGAICLRITALRELGQFYSAGVVIREGHRVINTGPYRYLHHPLHFALFFEAVGLLLLSTAWYASSLIGLLLFVNVVRNWREERLLERHLGDSY